MADNINQVEERPSADCRLRKCFPCCRDQAYLAWSCQRHDLQESTPIEQHGLSSDNSIEGSHRLSFMLQKIIGTVLVIEEWSSSFSLQARMFVLSRFALRKVNGIIRTDAVGCGIDIDDIDVVISSTCRATSTRKSVGPGEQKFQLTLAEAGKQPQEPIEIHSNAEEEYAVLYSAVLNDLCEALDLEKQTIKKIHSGMPNTSMTKVNLFSKLKDRVDIDPSSEMIEMLLFLPMTY
ncbi:hypothetical protein pipiens_012164 [Culex pipiens pipiens]|uniref:Uncharacterized protein n=1 Tax=Culex pipiens pipiens TaxID=38569 RepID=A0ABD1D3F5_CULPP